MSNSKLIERAEASVRAETGIIWDYHPGISVGTRIGNDRPTITDAFESSCAISHDSQGSSTQWLGPLRTSNAVYAYDGTLEGMFTALHAAFRAHDSEAEILESRHVQPRLGQDVYEVPMLLDEASKVRRLIEYSLGSQAFRFIRTAAASENPARGTVLHRFLRDVLPTSGRTGCNRCAKKERCTRACEHPATSSVLDDLANPAVFNLSKLYREVMNERHYMLQFMRFAHCEGDVWYARCNPKANVVPLMMEWFIPRFNDQRFLIYDENHGMSGVYDGERWYLVRGDDVTPPPHMDDERMMQRAWRRFYDSLAVEARYNPELRRGFMPMRLWRNLTEMRAW